MLSERDKKRALNLFLKGVSLDEIRCSLGVTLKAVRLAVYEGGYGGMTYCSNCKTQKLFVSAVLGSREVCDCGKYV